MMIVVVATLTALIVMKTYEAGKIYGWFSVVICLVRAAMVGRGGVELAAGGWGTVWIRGFWWERVGWRVVVEA